MPRVGLQDLSNEILREILECIEDNPDKLVGLDRREYLSQESFSVPVTPAHDQAEVIANFRGVCKRFAALGAIHQYAKWTTRFSRSGFTRLEELADDPKVAQHVRKFTLMVPYFYAEDRARLADVLPGLQQTVGAVDPASFDRKINDQRYLLQSREDARIITRALAAFTSLQHIQLLRVLDHDDAMLLGYLRQNEHLTQMVDLVWAPACAHSTNILAAAMLATGSRCSRFSSPMLSLQSPHELAQRNPGNLQALARQLTSLEVHFDDVHDLDAQWLNLPSLLNAVFSSARNLRSLHLGFPSHRPIDLRLEEIFRNVTWDRLSAFGIQAWKLDAEEIIDFARRHRETLRGLRLRDVLLRESSKWKNVLLYLREDMPFLEWISLRRIGYARYFEEQLETAGVEIPDEAPEDDSDTDDEEEEPSLEIFSNDPEIEQEHVDEEFASGDESDQDSDEPSDDDESGPHEMTFPDLTITDEPTIPFCTCGNRGTSPTSAEDLGDNGLFVTNLQRKQWEKWVIGRCPVHRNHPI